MATISTNIQLKFEGPELKGESKVAGHEEELDVLSYSWGVMQPSAGPTGEGSGASTAQFQTLTINKYIDKSSPTLMLKCANGQHFEKATLVAREAGGDETVDYLTIELTHVIIVAYNTSASGGGDKGMETVTLGARQIKIVYKTQDTAAGVEGAATEFAWNIAEQRPV